MPRDLLIDLGFTPPEADLYMFLLQESPATGYRAAQAINRPISQTYKAIESLAKKGAVLVDDGNTRMSRAVPPSEYFSQIQRSFKERVLIAKKALSQLSRTSEDDRVYQIESYEEVFERARTMLDGARKVVLVDLFPGPLSLLQKNIEATFARRRNVAIKLYKEAKVRASLQVVLFHGPDLIESWPGEVLNLAVDGRQFLSALVSTERREVRNAIWSTNPFLAARHHNGLSCEIGLTKILSLVARKSSYNSILSALKKLEPFYFQNSPGFKKLPKQKS